MIQISCEFAVRNVIFLDSLKVSKLIKITVQLLLSISIANWWDMTGWCRFLISWMLFELSLVLVLIWWIKTILVFKVLSQINDPLQSWRCCSINVACHRLGCYRSRGMIRNITDQFIFFISCRSNSVKVLKKWMIVWWISKPLRLIIKTLLFLLHNSSR